MIKYIISISSVSLFITIIFLLIPSGKTTNIVKFTLSFVLLFTVIEPLLKLDNCNFVNIDNNTANLIVQDNFLDFYNSKKIEYVSKYCQETIKNYGYNISSDDIIIELSDGQNVEQNIDIKKIKINLTKPVSIQEDKHIDNIEAIKQAILNYFNLENNTVVFV